ncbi:hypothetical protein [Clostridium paridis]|uniref:Uncharacterized protein n=1 Tax=Clostridium paridis TaxID=2803863 RepID=A0A937K5F6_9CLOT|nr:hypothetical protein [Clostridium paridis]MBL4932280.1 hypothetical protein [Clostridium paridis]
MNFGQNIFSIVQDNVGYLFLAVLVGLALYFLVKKEISKFVGFIVASLLASGFIFVPDVVKDILVNLFKKIFRVS